MGRLQWKQRRAGMRLVLGERLLCRETSARLVLLLCNVFWFQLIFAGFRFLIVIRRGYLSDTKGRWCSKCVHLSPKALREETEWKKLRGSSFNRCRRSRLTNSFVRILFMQCAKPPISMAYGHIGPKTVQTPDNLAPRHFGT